jgi:DNA primase
MIEGDKKHELMLEKKRLAAIKEARNKLLSALFKRTSIVLALMRDGGQERAIQAINAALGEHSKSRCDEFLALMYLQRVAAAPEHEREAMLQRLTPEFKAMIQALNRTSSGIQREADPCVVALEALFTAIRDSAIASQGVLGGLDLDESGRVIKRASATALFIALKNIDKARGLPFRFTTPSQFGRRLKGAKSLLSSSGIELQVIEDRHKHSSLYTIFDRRDSLAEMDKDSKPPQPGRHCTQFSTPLVWPPSDSAMEAS